MFPFCRVKMLTGVIQLILFVKKRLISPPNAKQAKTDLSKHSHFFLKFLNLIQLYTKFAFLVSTIFYTLIHHQNQNAHDRIGTRKPLHFISSFLTLVFYLHSIPSSSLYMQMATKDGSKVSLHGEKSWKEGQASIWTRSVLTGRLSRVEEAMSTWE